jgi:hypothetical protein
LGPQYIRSGSYHLECRHAWAFAFLAQAYLFNGRFINRAKRIAEKIVKSVFFETYLDALNENQYASQSLINLKERKALGKESVELKFEVHKNQNFGPG